MIRVLIVDDHELFRQSLKDIVESQADMVVIGEAATGVEALKQVKKNRPDIILMDVEMPEMDGIDATRQIRASFEGVNIIALSSHAEEHYTDKMKEAGADDYLSKICSRADLIDCIRIVWERTNRLNPN